MFVILKHGKKTFYKVIWPCVLKIFHNCIPHRLNFMINSYVLSSISYDVARFFFIGSFDLCLFFAGHVYVPPVVSVWSQWGLQSVQQRCLKRPLIHGGTYSGCYGNDHHRPKIKMNNPLRWLCYMYSLQCLLPLFLHFHQINIMKKNPESNRFDIQWWKFKGVSAI